MTAARAVRAGAALAWLLGLAAITLTPGGGWTARIVSFCLFCGERGAADALLNVVLFVPFGMLVGLRRGPVIALLLGLGVSAGVELGQLLLTGRYSNLGDLVWNGSGAVVGAAIIPYLRGWLNDPDRASARIAAVGLPLAWLAMATTLLAPRPGPPPYSVDHLASSSSIDGARSWHAAAALGRDIGPSASAPGDARLDLEPDGSWTLATRAVRVPLSYDLSPLVAAYDARGLPIRVLGADREDLVLWERTRAGAAGFDYASHHLYGGLLDHAEGDTMTVVASSPSRDEICLSTQAGETCRARIVPARTWTLLRSREHASESLKRWIDVAWMATLALFIGLLGGRPAATALAVGSFVGLVTALAWVTPLSLLSVPGWMGLVLGVVAGVMVRPLARLFVGEHAPHAPRARFRTWEPFPGFRPFA